MSVSHLRDAMHRQADRRAREGIPPPHVAALGEGLAAFGAEVKQRRETPRAPTPNRDGRADQADAKQEADAETRGDSPQVSKGGRRKGEGPPPNPFEAEDACAAALEAAEREMHYRDTVLPAGALVEASFVSVDERMIVGGARKWLAIFRILEVLPPHEDLLAGGLILRSWNPPSGRWLSPRHALAADWEAVVGRPLRTLPRRYTANALLGAAFRGVTVKALTRIVDSYHDPKTKTTKPQPPYSVIERLLGRTAGTPRVLERKASS